MSKAPTLSQFASLKGTELGGVIKRSQGTFYIAIGLTIVASGLLIATSSIGINVYNSCVDFNGSADRVSGLWIFFIIMLIISILIFIASIGAIFIYIRYFRGVNL